jgi:hypothetical protein
MRAKKVVGLTALAVAAVMLVGTGAAAQQLPLEPPHKAFGQAVWPVYEGWYDNPDGSITFLVGYFNPNKEQTFELPVGESNFFSPGEPDRGQPTHFATLRGWAVFGVRVDKSYAGKAKELTWTLVTNDQTASIPMHTDPGWYLEPFEDAANKNRPPALRFEAAGQAFEGPPVSGIASSYAAMVSKPLTVKMWTDDYKGAGYDAGSRQTATSNPPRTNRRRRPGLVLRWMKLRGPGDVTFDEERQTFQESKQTPETEITFSEPGEYILRVEALDETGSGGGGSQCCWTSAHIKVNVSAPPNTTGG